MLQNGSNRERERGGEGEFNTYFKRHMTFRKADGSLIRSEKI
jgi:hypothetical protein